MAASAAFVAAYWLLPGTPVMVRLPTRTTRPAVGEDTDEPADDELGAAHVHGPHPLALLGPQLVDAGGVLQAGGVDDGVHAAGRGLAHRPHGLVGRDHVSQVARHPRGGVRQRAARAAEPEDVPPGTDEVVGDGEADARAGPRDDRGACRALVRCGGGRLGPRRRRHRDGLRRRRSTTAGGQVHVLDGPPVVGVGHVQVTVRARQHRGVGELAVEPVAGVVGHAVAVAGLEVDRAPARCARRRG